MTTSKKEYNPIVGGDILSFLNEPAAGTAAAAAAKPTPIQKPAAKGLNLKSDEMFPSLGGGDNAQHNDVIQPKVVWASKPAMPVTSSSNISQTFELPAEQQKSLKSGFGNGHGKQQPRSVSQICAGIAAKTHTTIDASTSSKTRAITFIIRGKQADVAEAKKLLWAELAQPMTMPVEVAEEHLGQIIGASGRTLQAIMAETGTRINVSKKGEEYPGYVLVTGDADGVKQARAKIRAIVEEKEKRLVQSLALKAHLLPFVYGVSSSRVNEQPAVLSEHFRIKVSHEVDREKDEATITMSGDRDDVMLALNHLSSAHEEARKSIRSVSTAVPKAIHRFIIGPKGSTLHEMEAETSCIIHVPVADSPSDQVTIFGSEANLFRGLSMVLEKAGSLDNKTLPLSADVKQVVMDRFRGKLNEIETSFDVSIVQANDGLSVCGQKVKVPKAFTEVETLVKPFTSWKFDRTLNVDPKYFGHIIGRKGHNLTQLSTEFGVQVSLPHNSGEVVIAGPTDKAIKAAKEHLQSMISSVADFTTMEMRVEQKYHGGLIGRGGSNLQKYHEAFPTVVVLFEDGSDVVLIKGSSAQVQGALAKLKEDVDALKHEAIMNGYTTELELNPKQAAVAFESNGNALARWVITMAREHEVKAMIDGSKKSAKASSISLQGLKKNVEAASKDILERIAVLENQGSLSFEIDQRYHALLIGKGGKNMKHLAKKFQVRASFPPADATGNDAIVLTGPKNNLAAAKAELIDLYQYLVDHRHQVELTAPRGAVGLILGKGGAGITDLALDTETQIDLDKSSDATPEADQVRIVITGTEEGVQKASQAIKEIIAKFESQANEAVALDADQLVKLLGSAAFAYRVIADKHSVSINLQGNRGDAGSLVVRGDKETVAEALKEVHALLKTLSSFVTVQLELPVRSHAEIIGARGENIRRLSAELGVRIDIPRGAQDPKVAVSGPQEKVEAAVKHLTTQYAKDEAIIPVASRDLRVQYASTLGKAVEAAYPGTKVTDVREGLLVRAPTACLANALASLKISISKIEASQTKDSISVPKSKHGLLIGARGANAKMLREASGCRIVVPPADSTSEDIELIGTAEQIEKAKEEIAKLLSA